MKMRLKGRDAESIGRPDGRGCTQKDDESESGNLLGTRPDCHRDPGRHGAATPPASALSNIAD